jgi:hypothetical protein
MAQEEIRRVSPLQDRTITPKELEMAFLQLADPWQPLPPELKKLSLNLLDWGTLAEMLSELEEEKANGLVH